MVKIKAITLIILVFTFIGIIHGAILNSVNVFVSWIFIGIWLIFSFKVLKNIKQHREYNSPHNTAFFTISPVFIGIFYSIWGNFTVLLGEDLLEGSDLFLSWWSIIFGTPYILYSAISLYRCFKKYNVIYFGTKSIDARKFGYMLSISILLFIIIYWISFYSLIEFYDLNLFILLISTILIILIPGLFGTRSRLPQLTRNYITERTNRLNQLTSPRSNTTPQRYRKSVRTTTNSSPTPSTRSVTNRSRSVSHSSRSTPTSQRRSTTSRSKTTTRTTSRSPTGTKVSSKQSTRKITNFNLYKPKAGRLSTEDFKCIFCFKLPKIPEDRGRGIILCPNCRYPAHADEFKDWLRSSNLCSRCNATIPASYKKNPKILTVKNYIVVVKHFVNNRK
ncbi:MAG: hypothetical protein KGD58_08625 [Candidatus Lokiarchaeota archaeon]|nr:hypothetical protein [Candidatus Lokiarchaeota archaeon]